MLTTTRQTSWGVIAAVVVANILLVALSQFVAPFRPLARITGPWLPVTLMVAIDFLIVVGGLMLVAGKLGLSDLGLIRRNAWSGVVFTVSLWVILQVAVAVASLGSVSPLSMATWIRETPSGTLGRAGYDLVGTALFEEIIFRGFLLQQLWLKFAGANGRRRVVGFLAAIVVSQGVFALSHLPQRIHSGVPAADMPAGVLVLFMWGVLFSLVFVSGGSLLYSVGAHMLINAPLPLIESAESAPLIVGATIVVWLVTVCLWRWLQRRERRRQAQRQPDR